MFKEPINRLRVVLCLAVCCFGALAPQSNASDGSDWSDGFGYGPLWSHFRLTLDEGQRTEALGPLFYEQYRDSEHTVALPPFFSHHEDSATDSEEYDFFYPVATYDRFGTEFRWHFFQLLSFAGGHNQAAVPARRFTIFPFYFQQRSPETNLNYTAFFPFYGQLKRRLFKEEISFTAWPIYVQTRKRDVITDNYFYPFYHQRRGDGLKGWQLWPFYGREYKEVTTRTNSFAEEEHVAGRDRVFVGWPFYFKETSGLGTEDPEQQMGLLPFFTSVRSPKRDSTTILWPLITWTDDREKNYREWDFPWPLMVIARGEGKTTTRIFPFYSHAQTTNLQSKFLLWPLYKYNRMHADPLDRDRTRILFFLYSKVQEKNTETGKARLRTDLWPFFTHRTDFNGNQRLQWLAPLEPIFPKSHSVDRDWSPLWSVWVAEKNPRTGGASQSLLWNLYRHETTPTTKKLSLLFGLFQYQSAAGVSRSRLFFIPLTKTKQDSGLRQTAPPASGEGAAFDDLKTKRNPLGAGPATAQHVPEPR